MSEKKKYIGITIGPIFDTMDLVSSPSALWASSYIFSFISRSLCEKLTEEYKVTGIVSPYFDKADPTLTVNDGVGLFHDRIIFEKPKDFDVKTVDKLRADVIKDVALRFDINNTNRYLDEYLMIAAAEFEAENPLLEGDSILNSLELSKKFVYAETENPILSTFTSDLSSADEKGTRNQRIKDVVKHSLQIDGWQLFKDNELGIKDLGSIAHCDDTDRKYNEYCAIIRADGDRIGSIIKGVTDFKTFSKTCFTYCAGAAKLVKEFGGVTIYAGGDDLLAILPCRSETGTLFDFASRLKELFNKAFKAYIDAAADPKPSLSTGIYIFYHKFPLYEALSESVSLLFNTAKSKRNCAAIRLRKNSGQSAELIVPNNSLAKVIELQNVILPGVNDPEIIMSALQKIALFGNLFNGAQTDKQIGNLFANTFDASAHVGNAFLHTTLADHYNAYRPGGSTPVYSADPEEKFADTFSSLLRIFKFYLEKKGEK